MRSGLCYIVDKRSIDDHETSPQLSKSVAWSSCYTGNKTTLPPPMKYPICFISQSQAKAAKRAYVCSASSMLNLKLLIHHSNNQA